jgi:NAD+ diphosphatase
MSGPYEIQVDSKLFDHLGKARLEKGAAGEVVMVIPRPGGRILLMTKRFYPCGIFRLPTGAVKPGETPEAAFAREMREETGFQVKAEQYFGRIDYVFVYGNERERFSSHVFLSEPTSDEIRPEDEEEEITEFREILPEALEDVARSLEGLAESTPEWAGWGKFRAIAHRFARQCVFGR